MNTDDPARSISSSGFSILDPGLVVEILSFCNLPDLLLLLDTSLDFFLNQVQCSLSTRTTLCVSSLLKIVPNSIKSSKSDHRQSLVISKLIQLIQHTHILKHLEFSGLRHITGKEWIPQLEDQVALQSLNLSGCASLDPDLLNHFLLHCKTSLRHLNLLGCVRADVVVVRTIALNHSQIESLSLGGCSQTINTPSIRHLLERLRNLKQLDIQALNNISDPILGLLPTCISSINFSSCKRLSLASEEAVTQQARQMQANTISWNEVPISNHKIQHLVLDALGTPRAGLYPGVLTYFALGRCLREVHLAGCEQVLDWEIDVLAQVCGRTLTVFQMRAACIGNEALIALANNCNILAMCDVSACYEVGDEGILALCRSSYIPRHEAAVSHQFGKRRAKASPLRSLKIASLPKLTNMAVSAIKNLANLHILDVHDCPNVTSNVLCETIVSLPQLIEVNAKDIADYHNSLSALIRQHKSIPKGLRFVNQRPVSLPSNAQAHHGEHPCCSVRKYSQRVNASIPLQLMYHCVDCNLLPATNSGMCANCTKCHTGHRVFLGSYTRFYCDCPFSIAGNECQVIF